MAARLITIGLALAVAATACGSPTDTGRAQGPAPFDAVLIELFDTTDTDAYLAGAERRAAELVVECMQAAGFEFAIAAEQEVDTTTDRDTLDYARREGFGVITGFLDSLDDFDEATPDPEAVNLAYLRSLTGAEIERFLVTLNGSPAEPGQLQTDRGCNGEAADATYADWERFQQTLPSYRTLGEDRDTHPDWLAARAIWSECMADKGYDYTEPEVIMSDVRTRMGAIVEERYPGGVLPLVTTADGLVLDPEVQLLLDEMAEFERAAAVANFECTEPIADRFDAANRIVQQDFVDRNQAVLDELLAGD